MPEWISSALQNNLSCRMLVDDLSSNERELSGGGDNRSYNKSAPLCAIEGLRDWTTPYLGNDVVNRRYNRFTP